jgi:prepilin-type N-terminal cleavage/methylation domain-containing protein
MAKLNPLSRSAQFRAMSFAARQRGLSLVELMVGIAIGLFVVAAASLVVSSQLNDNRRLLLELQVQQDLRATADIITRELRRAGYWDASQTGISNAALDPPALPSPNTYLNVSVGGAGNSIAYKYKRANSEEGPFGYELTGGVIRTKLTSQTEWQDLTDVNTLVVDAFSIVPGAANAVRLPCPKDCPAGIVGDSCWPTVSVRDFTVTITGHARSDSAITRTVTSQVRLRNDQVRFFSGALGSDACPT